MQNQENDKFSHPSLTEEYLAQFPPDRCEIPHPTVRGVVYIRPDTATVADGMEILHEMMREVGRKLREKAYSK